MNRFKSLLLLFVVATFLFTAVNVSAIEYGGMGGRPAYPRQDNPRTESIFVHTLNPGAIVSDGVRVINNSETSKTMLVYAVDSVVSSGGAFSCAQAADAKNDVGSWIKLAKNEVTLSSLTTEVIPFTLKAPQNASVGEHNGCIVVQEKKEADPNATGVVLSFRTGLRVAVLIPGEIIRKLAIGGIKVSKSEQGDIVINPKVKNEGNVSVDADIQVATRYFFGKTLEKHGGEYPILSGEESEWNYKIVKPFWGGLFRTSYAVKYDQSKEAGVGVQTQNPLTELKTKPVWFFSMPAWPALLLELLVLAVLMYVVWRLLVKRRRDQLIQKTWVDYVVKSGDDIQHLGDKFGVPWKLLARVNRLKEPYTLAPGDKLKTPPK
jgi:hypothetical protein